MGSYAATFALVGGTFAIVDCLAETVRGEVFPLDVAVYLLMYMP